MEKSGRRRGCLGSFRLGRIVDFETCLVYMRTAFLNDGRMYHFHGQVVTVTWNPFPCLAHASLFLLFRTCSLWSKGSKKHKMAFSLVEELRSSDERVRKCHATRGQGGLCTTPEVWSMASNWTCTCTTTWSKPRPWKLICSRCVHNPWNPCHITSLGRQVKYGNPWVSTILTGRELGKDLSQDLSLKRPADRLASQQLSADTCLSWDVRHFLMYARGSVVSSRLGASRKPLMRWEVKTWKQAPARKGAG